MNDMITAIIPTLSNTSGLKKVVTWLSDHGYQTIVIDNQPSPQKQKFCQLNKVIYLPQAKNMGFAAAINLGAKQVTTPWMLILNDDIEFLEKDTLEKLIKVADRNKWSAVSPVLQRPSGETENLGYTLLPQGKVKLNYDPQLKNLDGITAACLLIKSDVFKQLTGFDERFFAYLEDVDLFLRLKKAGFTFGVAQEIKVIHNHMTTSSKMGNFKAKMDLRNWCFVIIKNWDLKILIKNFIPIVIERLKNLSGYLKTTKQSYSWKSIYIIPKDLISITIDLLYYVFKF